MIDVRGEVKKLPRSSVARIIWLHSDADVDGGDATDDERPGDEWPSGLLVQGVADGGRVTLVAEAVAEEAGKREAAASGRGGGDGDGDGDEPWQWGGNAAGGELPACRQTFGHRLSHADAIKAFAGHAFAQGP